MQRARTPAALRVLGRVLLWMPAEPTIQSADQFEELSAPYAELGFDQIVLHHPDQTGPFGGNVAAFEEIAARAETPPPDESEPLSALGSHLVARHIDRSGDGTDDEVAGRNVRKARVRVRGARRLPSASLAPSSRERPVHGRAQLREELVLFFLDMMADVLDEDRDLGGESLIGRIEAIQL